VTFKTEQEKFWAGEFGDEYQLRNQGAKTVAANVALFSKILSQVNKPNAIIEFGANIGLNLDALSILLPEIELAAIEINKNAAEKLSRFDKIDVFNESILEYQPQKTYDLALIKGVLIHINPDELEKVYERLYLSSHQYICIAEYYNPTPMSVSYRGHQERLFKRDFAGEMLDKYPDLTLVDYGFVYHRDNNFPQDDTTWFLLEKHVK
jgi:spore coat polysaccharide biosynthesis protein SpsF